MYKLDKRIPNSLLRATNFNRLLLHASQDWLVISLCVFGMLMSPAAYYPIFVILMAGRFHSLGVILHDVAHTKIKKKTFKIRLLEVLAGYSIFVTIESMAYHHNRHHRNTNTNMDPYFKFSKAIGPKRKAALSLVKGLILILVWFLRPFFAPFALVNPKLRSFYAKVFIQDISNKDISESKEVIKCLKEDIPALIFNICVITLTVMFPILIYCYLIPVTIGGIFCVYRLLVEHEYEKMENTSKTSVLKCTFDHHLKWYDQLFFAPRNIGYHIAHHLYPTVAYEHLPNIHQFYKEEAIA